MQTHSSLEINPLVNNFSKDFTGLNLFTCKAVQKGILPDGPVLGILASIAEGMGAPWSGN